MQNTQLYVEYLKNFKPQNDQHQKTIGMECEFPVVTQKGQSVSLEIVTELFHYLENFGFEVKRDENSNRAIAAERINAKSAESGVYCKDVITTDLGIGTLEIALAPQKNLFDCQAVLSELLAWVLEYLERRDCRLLGYGVQPFSRPSRRLMIPHKLYNFIGRASGNHFVPISDGKDFHLLTVSASNQCHVAVSQEEAISAMNVLNGLSGFQIALQANSPIWRGKVDPNYKAVRELFWNYCFPDRLHQACIPPIFQGWKDYLAYLMDFRAQRVIRDGVPYRIITKSTFREFYNQEVLTIGENRRGQQKIIEPKAEDIHTQNGFCYFNARLVSKFGTIENRMCCQQPPGETLVTAALTMGILENLEAATALSEELNFVSRAALRMQAIQYAMAAQIDNQSIIPWLQQLLVVAKKGLEKRQLGEEIFLTPLWDRLQERKIPADTAIQVFNAYGRSGFLEQFSFKIKNLKQGVKSNLVTTLSY